MNTELAELSSKFADITRQSTLWEIRDAVNAAVQLAVDEDGVVDPEWSQLIDALNLTLEQKVEACFVVANEEHERSVMYRRIADRYAKMASASHRREARLKDYVMHCLQSMGLVTCKTPTVRACIERSPECVTLVDGMPIESVPPEFVIVERRIDKAKLAKALKAGAQFAWARLSRGEHLRWR